VLVVEDERRLAAAVRRGLQAEGFAVDLAHDGEDGLHMAREGDYDAIVLDLMLPKISGYRICRQLRAEKNWVPILILSAKDGEYDQADGLDLGADDYLTKPFSYVVLAARLRALLRRGARPRPAQLQAGDLSLDPGTRQVCRGETEIELTPREFALLEYLMRVRLGRPQRGRGLRELPPAQDRQPVRPPRAADRPRRGLQARSRRGMTTPCRGGGGGAACGPG
jgi:DNA-binding response OmpR family regulator